MNRHDNDVVDPIVNLGEDMICSTEESQQTLTSCYSPSAPPPKIEHVVTFEEQQHDEEKANDSSYEKLDMTNLEKSTQPFDNMTNEVVVTAATAASDHETCLNAQSAMTTCNSASVEHAAPPQQVTNGYSERF